MAKALLILTLLLAGCAAPRTCENAMQPVWKPWECHHVPIQYGPPPRKIIQTDHFPFYKEDYEKDLLTN